MTSLDQLRQRLFDSGAFVALGKRIFPRTDVWLHRRTRGRVSLASMGGVKILLLTTTGRSTGQPRVTPVTYVTDGDDGYFVVGSNWGEDHQPAWALNLLANPNATIEIGGEPMPVTARHIQGQERAVIWQRLVELWPPYGTYAAKVGGRELPVFLLAP